MPRRSGVDHRQNAGRGLGAGRPTRRVRTIPVQGVWAPDANCELSYLPRWQQDDDVHQIPHFAQFRRESPLAMTLPPHLFPVANWLASGFAPEKGVPPGTISSKQRERPLHGTRRRQVNRRAARRVPRRWLCSELMTTMHSIECPAISQMDYAVGYGGHPECGRN